jgi:glucan phosphoethanolaminetransferase (alkaline phosphatase superfamily)
MIQRIQTIFLALAAATGFGVLALPFAKTGQAVQTSSLFADAAYSATDHIGLMVLFAVAGALAVASLLMFTNRPLQAKLCRFGIIANVMGLILAIVLFWQDGIMQQGNEVNDDAGAYLPFVFLIFGILALRYIQKDDNLVKSMDRLR